METKFSLQEELAQRDAGIIQEASISRNGLKRLDKTLGADAKKKLGAKNIKITKTFKDHFICYVLGDDGKKVFYRIGYAISRDGMISLGTIEATKNDEPDKIRQALNPESRHVPSELTLEQKYKQQIDAGLAPYKGKGLVPGSDLSFEDFKIALRDAVQLKLGAKYLYIIHTYGARVVVSIDDGQGHEELYELSYKVSKGQIELGAPVRVTKKTTFVKAEARTPGMRLMEKRYQQHLAGVDTDSTQQALSESRGTRRELKEVVTHGQVRILDEAKIEGLASRAEVVNNNGRRYCLSVLQKQPVDLKQKIEKGQFLCFLDHAPDGQALLKDATAKITSLEMQGNDLKYEAEILNTPGGKILNSLLKAGVTVENSIKGYGSTKKVQIDGKEIEDVLEDYELASIDFVSGASTEGAEITRWT